MPTGAPESDALDAAPTGPATEPDILPVDLAFLRRYTLGDMVLQKEVLDLFASQLDVSITSLRTAVTADDWLRAAHTLKGSARAVGANPLASALEDAETLSDVNDVGSRRAVLARIEAEAGLVAAFIVSASA
jgi:HPt (histidine-containing phosphotransfer) domain-containing protein